MRLLQVPGFAISLALASQHAFAQSPDVGRPQFDDRQQVLAIYSTVRVLFDNEDFRNLERLADGFRDGRAVTSSGRPDLDAYYGAFASYPITGDMSDPRIDKAKRWLSAYPKSSAAHIVMGTLLENQTLALSQLAGNSVLAGTKALYDSAPAKIENGFKEAERFLVENEPLLRDEPYYYGLRIDFAARRGAKEEEILGLYRTARTRFPDYFTLKFEALLWLANSWGFDPGRVDAFISEATESSRAGNGQGDYADLYWWLYVLHAKGDLFTATKANWPRLRQGIEDRIKRFGGATNANRYAMLACLAGDKAIAKRMFEKIGNTFDPEIWNQQSLNQCWSWAIEDRGVPLGQVLTP